MNNPHNRELPDELETAVLVRRPRTPDGRFALANQGAVKNTIDEASEESVTINLNRKVRICAGRHFSNNRCAAQRGLIDCPRPGASGNRNGDCERIQSRLPPQRDLVDCRALRRPTWSRTVIWEEAYGLPRARFTRCASTDLCDGRNHGLIARGMPFASSKHSEQLNHNPLHALTYPTTPASRCEPPRETEKRVATVVHKDYTRSRRAGSTSALRRCGVRRVTQ